MNTPDNSYLIIANFPNNNVHFDNDYAKIIDVVEAPNPDDAFHSFIQKHADDAYKAQRFYEEVYVVPNQPKSYRYSIREHYGDIARNWEFPNHGLLKH